MFVVNADQERSRETEDRVPLALAALNAVARSTGLAFERTMGDEVQGMLGSGDDVVTVCRALARLTAWHVAIGVGDVEHPLPSTTREARGAAFLAARRAADDVKGRRPSILVAGGEDRSEIADADTIMRLLALLWQRRSPSGWEAIEATERMRAQEPGVSLSRVAAGLGITHQALSQRLQAAGWDVEVAALASAARLLDRADDVSAQKGERS
jgi:hypothetical protein